MNECKKIITDKDCNIIVIDNTFNSNYIQVFILESNPLNYSETFIKSSSEQTVAFNNCPDGFYILCKVEIPINQSNSVYYKDGNFYYNDNKVSLQDIIQIPLEDSQINVEYNHFFSICNLKKCFIRICQSIFQQSKGSICKQQNLDNSLVYKRDLLWSTINVIQYMAEMDQMLEAQRLLEEITSCNGLCPSKKENDCGCGRV